MAADLSDRVWSVAEVFIERVHRRCDRHGCDCVRRQGDHPQGNDRSRIGNPHSGSRAILKGDQKDDTW